MEEIKSGSQQVSTLSLENFIISGPLNQEDVTYNKFIKGNSALETLEKGIPLTDFVKVSESIDVFGEAKKLDKVTINQETAQLLNTDEEVRQFNRYSDILPYKRNCVVIPIDSFGKNTYINASYVGSSIKGDDKSFIVCQSPLDKTITDFWKMIINEGTHTIVMLCKFKAGSRVQSCEYFPDIKDIEFNGFKGVSLKEKIVKHEMDLIERRFLVKRGDGTSKEVVHYQWEGWPDHGVPEENQYGVLLYLVQQIMERRKLGKEPVVVHCSAGIGRSGTIVAIHNLAQIVEWSLNTKNNAEKEKARLSVFSTVRRLREQRFGMVQTAPQYELIYRIVSKILKNPKILFGK